MESFFEPRSVAVAGVSSDPDKIGSIIFANLLENAEKGLLKASVYALNPAHDRIGDQPCYPAIRSLPEVPDLLIVAVPEPLTLDLVRDAAEAGVRAAVLVTSGYAEVGRGSVQEEVGREAARHGMRILGPNTIGLYDTRSGVDSLFIRPTKTLPDGSRIVSFVKPLPGGVAVVTQSGHLGETVSEELAARGVGIRALVGTGNQLDVSVEDVVQYFADDERTRVVVVYLEGVRDGRRFMEVASSVSRKKPIVVFKVGKTGVGARAALTHTASLVGDYDVYRAAFRASGVIEADDLQEMVDYTVALSMLPRAEGKRLFVVTNAGGVGAIAADRAEKTGLEVRPMGDEARKRIRDEFERSHFIANASLGNPVDLTASASTDEFARAMELVLALPECDLALAMPTHQTPAIGPDISAKLGEVAAKSKKPLAVCVIGDSELATKIQRDFMARGIPTFPTPERAVRALAAVAPHGGGRRLGRGAGKKAPPHLHVKGQLPQQQVSTLLRSYAIREPRSVVVRYSGDLGGVRKLTFPVACKILAMGVLHKKDVGGVAVDVGSAGEVGSLLSRFRKLAARRGFRFDGMLVQEMVKGGVEVILGGTRDPTFGPVVAFGLGGTYTELLRDYSLAIAPVTPKEVKEMLDGTSLGRVLAGYRGGPRGNLDGLSQVISRFSRIMVEDASVEDVEVNPLIVKGKEILAVDARAMVR